MRDAIVQKSPFAPNIYQVEVDCGVVFDLRKLLGLGDNNVLDGCVRIVEFILRDVENYASRKQADKTGRLAFFPKPSNGALCLDYTGMHDLDTPYRIVGELYPHTMIGKVDANSTGTNLTMIGVVLELQITSTNMSDHAAVFDRREDIVEIDHVAVARDHLLELAKAFPESGLDEATMDTLDQVIALAKKLKRRQLVNELAGTIILSCGVGGELVGYASKK